MFEESSNWSISLDLFDWLATHPKGRIVLIGCCLWCSVTLIVRMWVVHRKTSVLKKALWSFALLFPFFGWLFYLAWFTTPDISDCPPSTYSVG